MKLINYGLIGIMVLSAIFFTENMTVAALKTTQYQTQYYQLVLSHAAEDAANAIKTSATNDVNKERSLKIEQPHLAVEAFITSLANSLSMTSKGDMIWLSNFIPYIVMVDNSGYYIYAVSPGEESGYQYQRKLLPRIDFMHKIDDYYIFLDDAPTIKIMHRQGGQWQVNYRSLADWLDIIDNTAVKDFLSAPNYKRRIAQLKLRQLESDLSDIVNLHNQYAHERGLFYDFAIEPIAGKWTGVVERPTIIAALQGMPLANNQVFDQVVAHYASVIREEKYYGFVYNGVKYYASLDQLPVSLHLTDNVFFNPQDAAKKGYYPYE